MNKMKEYIRLFEQADADAMYGDIHPEKFGRQNGQSFTEPGVRFADNPKIRQAANIVPNTANNYQEPITEFSETEVAPQIDQIHDALNKAGMTDLEIRQGVNLTHRGKEKLAGKLGISTQQVDLYINSLIQNLNDEANKTTDALLSDYYSGMSEGADRPIWAGEESDWDDEDEDKEKKKSRVKDRTEARRHKEKQNPFREGIMIEDRYSYEKDILGNVTVRDAQTGKEKFLQGSSAQAVLSKLNGDADQDEVLAPLMEEITEKSIPFEDEIKADSGTYNFEWKYQGERGTGTVFYSMKNNKPLIKLMSIRDAAGDEIEDDLDSDQLDSILDQAKAFIGDA